MARKDSIKKMYDVLVKRRDALRRALAGDLSLLQQLSDQADVIDVAIDAAQDEISSQLAEVESRELANIERALESMKEGTYGNCEICNSKIPLARLQALPYATMCIECQRAEEEGNLDARREANWSRVVDSDFNAADVSMSDLEMQ